jgi:hypothetical protein
MPFSVAAPLILSIIWAVLGFFGSSMADVLSNCTEGGPSSKFPAGNPGLAMIVSAAIPERQAALGADKPE